MTAVRRASVEDGDTATSVLSRVTHMPEPFRRACIEAWRAAVASSEPRAFSVSDEPGGPATGILVCSGVALAPHVVDLEWLVVPRTARSREAAESLVHHAIAQRSRGRSTLVRFSGGRWHRGGAEAHLLDAIGMRRVAIVDDFYGLAEPLHVFVMRIGGSAEVPFAPTDPAALLDAAFAYRAFDDEKAFLLACADRFGSTTVRRAASWACGTARHLLALSEDGISGVAIDDNLDLLALGKRLHRARGVLATEFVEAPIDRIMSRAPVDMSFCMLSAVHRLASPEGIRAHLRAAAHLLVPGGIHVVEATLPVDATPDGNTTTSWTETRGEYRVHSRFVIDVSDVAADGTLPTHLEVRCRPVDDPGVVASVQQQERWIVPTLESWREIFESVPELSLEATFGDFQLDVAWNQPGAWRLLLVARRV